MMEFIANVNWQEWAFAVTGVVTASAVVAKLTPTKADDKVVNFLLKVLHFVAINPKTKDEDTEVK